VSESLIIEGKQYISARRAAEITAYSKDYVGQLCRSGKLACRMVGRFWYVDEESLQKHQAESFKANQTSFGANGSMPKTSVASNSLNPSISASTSIPVNQSISVGPSIPADSFFSHSFLPAFKQTFFVLAVMIAVLAGGTAAVSISKPFLPKSFSQNLSQTLNNITASVYSAMSSAGEILRTAFDHYYSAIASIVSPSAPSSQSNSQSKLPVSSIPPSGNYSVANAGLVVVPSQGSTTDAKLAQAITNSFSDNVTVTPGTNGTTGIITPEFRNVQGHDFLYMLVPVKTASTTASSTTQ